MFSEAVGQSLRPVTTAVRGSRRTERTVVATEVAVISLINNSSNSRTKTQHKKKWLPVGAAMLVVHRWNQRLEH